MLTQIEQPVSMDENGCIGLVEIDQHLPALDDVVGELGVEREQVRDRGASSLGT